MIRCNHLIDATGVPTGHNRANGKAVLPAEDRLVHFVSEQNVARFGSNGMLRAKLISPRGLCRSVESRRGSGALRNNFEAADPSARRARSTKVRAVKSILRAAFHWTKRATFLLAYKMNESIFAGARLPVRRDCARLVRGASIKWLQRIIVTDKPFNGYYQSSITHFGTGRGAARPPPLQKYKPKAEIYSQAT